MCRSAFCTLVYLKLEQNSGWASKLDACLLWQMCSEVLLYCFAVLFKKRPCEVEAWGSSWALLVSMSALRRTCCVAFEPSATG